jgi:hypothetical protein
VLADLPADGVVGASVNGEFEVKAGVVFKLGVLVTDGRNKQNGNFLSFTAGPRCGFPPKNARAETCSSSELACCESFVTRLRKNESVVLPFSIFPVMLRTSWLSSSLGGV